MIDKELSRYICAGNGFLSSIYPYETLIQLACSDLHNRLVCVLLGFQQRNLALIFLKLFMYQFYTFSILWVVADRCPSWLRIYFIAINTKTVGCNHILSENHRYDYSELNIAIMTACRIILILFSKNLVPMIIHIWFLCSVSKFPLCLRFKE